MATSDNLCFCGGFFSSDTNEMFCVHLSVLPEPCGDTEANLKNMTMERDELKSKLASFSECRNKSTTVTFCFFSDHLTLPGFTGLWTSPWLDCFFFFSV